MTVSEIVASLRSDLGGAAFEEPNQGLVHGDPAMSVTRILVCQSPSVGVLRQAAALPGTLVVSREHPFYAHDETVWSAKVEQTLRDAKDPVVLGKQAILDGAPIALYRLSRMWDAAHPKAQAEALAEVLGWKATASGGGRKAVCDVKPTTLAQLARQVDAKLDAGHVRVLGPRGARIRRVALLPEFVSVADAREIMASVPAIDGLVCGETTEWEGGPYFKDTLDMRRAPIGVIFAGTQPTQEPGVRRMYGWIAQRFAPLPVSYVDIARPVRSLESRP